MGQNGHGYVGQQVKNKRSEIGHNLLWLFTTTEAFNNKYLKVKS